jgi:hypothetical protein
MTLLQFIAIDHCASLRTELVAAQLFDEKMVDKLLSTYFLTLLKNTWLEHWVMGVYSKVVALPPSLSELRADLHKLYPEKMSSHLSVVPRAHQASSTASASHPQLPKEYCCYCHQMYGKLRKHAVPDCIPLRRKLAAQPRVVPSTDHLSPVPAPHSFRGHGRGAERGRWHGRGRQAGRGQAHALFPHPVSQPVPYTVPAGMHVQYPSTLQYVLPVQPTARPGSVRPSPNSSCYAIGLASAYNTFAASQSSSTNITLFDTGCTDHMTNDIADLRDVVHESSSLHLAAEQASVAVQAVGQWDLINHRGIPITLRALYVPSLKCKLVSWSKLDAALPQ